MNENIDLTKILDGCPVRQKFYSTVSGDVEFIRLLDSKKILFTYNDGDCYCDLFVQSDGKFNSNGECIIFPSKDQRDWSKFERFWDKPKIERFDPMTLQPFDRVLARDCSEDLWRVEIFGHIDGDHNCHCISIWDMCVPYNDDTKHLLGTTQDCPEYYKWWEEQL